MWATERRQRERERVRERERRKARESKADGVMGGRVRGRCERVGGTKYTRSRAPTRATLTYCLRSCSCCSRHHHHHLATTTFPLRTCHGQGDSGPHPQPRTLRQQCQCPPCPLALASRQRCCCAAAAHHAFVGSWSAALHPRLLGLVRARDTVLLSLEGGSPPGACPGWPRRQRAGRTVCTSPSANQRKSSYVAGPATPHARHKQPKSRARACI